jgi:asparagine synthase (glutamine-hydrolysing)
MEWPDVVGRAVETHRDRAALLRLMATDVETYLPEDILVKVDRASMAVGLEVRSPLLDHRLLQLVMAADPRWIADAQGGKVPLRTIYGVQLPPAVFNRPKTGFGVPLGRWLRSDLDTFASDRLLDRRAPIAALLDRAATRRMLLLHRAGAGDHSVWIWNLLVLDAWLDLWRPAIRTASASAPEPAFALP